MKEHTKVRCTNCRKILNFYFGSVWVKPSKTCEHTELIGVTKNE